MAYVYRHIRLDKNQPFYIGISKTNDYIRAYQEGSRRNKIWNDIRRKTDIRVDIMIDDLDWEEACEKEKEFISLYGRIDIGTGTLSNMTNGGDGIIGQVYSDETKKKISKALTGLKRKPLSDELKMKISMSVKGFKHTEETLRKMFDYHKNNLNPASKLVLNFETGIYYDTGKDAATSCNINVKYFRSMLSGQDRNKTSFKYV